LRHPVPDQAATDAPALQRRRWPAGDLDDAGESGDTTATPASAPGPVARRARVLRGRRAAGRRVRVTYVVPSLEIGGAERQLVKLVNNLDPSSFEVAVVCLGADPALLSELASHVRVRCAGLRGAGRHRWLRRWARAILLVPTVVLDLTLRRPEVVHTYLPAAYVVASLAARLLAIPAIVASRMSLSRIENYPHRTLRLLADPANRVIDFQVCDSEAARRVVVSTEQVEAGRTRVIHSGSQLPDLEGPVPAAPEGWGLRRREQSAVSLANLTWHKGHEVLMRAVAEVVRRHREFRLVLVGEGPERGRIEGLVRELGLGGNVVLAGSVGQASRLLGHFQFSVLASVQESFPNAVVESMAAGVPVVATRVGGIPELVREGVDGLLVGAGEPGELAASMRRLLEEPGLAERMGWAARERIRESFSIEKMVRETEDLYLNLLGARPGSLLSAISREGSSGSRG
jgi:glycosyltransferase involved in cell wall biosynthesis